MENKAKLESKFAKFNQIRNQPRFNKNQSAKKPLKDTKNTEIAQDMSGCRLTDAIAKDWADNFPIVDALREASVSNDCVRGHV